MSCLRDGKYEVLLELGLKRQKEGELAREVLEEQLSMGFPGLGQVVREIRELGLPDTTQLDSQKKLIKDQHDQRNGNV